MLTPKFVMTCLLALVPAGGALAGASPISLGAAGTFAVLAGSAVTSTGSTVVSGNLGVWPNDAVSGFPPGIVLNGQIDAGNATAMQAQAALAGAWQAAANEAGAESLTGQNLGGMSLAPGLYAFSSDALLDGTLTLNAGNIADAVFIFQITSTLTTASDAVVQLLNFGAGDQIIWQIGSSATLGSNTDFAGDILAAESITLGTGAAISCGGALAINGAVTLQNNDISTSGVACPAGGVQVPEPGSLVLLLGALCCAMLRPMGRALALRSRA